MITLTKHVLTKDVLREDVVTLEIKKEDSYPTKYTISIGPEGNPHNTRLDLGEENWQSLLNLIEQVKGVP